MSGHPHICAYCRHWMIGTLEHTTRRLAEMTDDRDCMYVCHITQPQMTAACESCDNFEPAHLVNDPEEMQP